jgi:hypothetical protein
MEFNGIPSTSVSWNSMKNSMEFHGKFHEIPLNSAEFHGNFHEIPWDFS